MATSTATASDIPSQYARQETVVILVGPSAEKYIVHKDLIAAKSPYFRTRLKDCWNQTVKEIKIPDVTIQGFNIVLDWMYGGKLPKRLTDHTTETPGYTRDAFETADMLMMVLLQNELIRNEAACLRTKNLGYPFSFVKYAYDHGLHHSKYYQFVLRGAINFTSSQDSEKFDEGMLAIADDAQIMADVVRSMRAWNKAPWRKFPEDDLSQYLVEEIKE